jgi:hypothetical protein
MAENLSRTVRFKPDEIKLVEKFLSANPLFDFSTLTRTAVLNFIRNPQITVTPVTDPVKKLKSKSEVTHGTN